MIFLRDRTNMNSEQEHEREFIGAKPDRRENNRFPVRAEARYRVFQSKAVQLVGAGKTLDFSSGGVLFTTSEPLPTGRLIEISVTWPARLDGTCPLQFVAIGRIVRADAAKAAMRIKRYEFKTLSSAALTAGA